MFKFYIATVKSSRGVEILRYSTSIPKDTPRFDEDLVSKVNDYYNGNAENIEVLAVTDDRFLGRI